MTTELDMELLEAALDGALSPAEQAALEQRLATEPELAALRRELAAERQLRMAVFASMEPDEQTALAVVDRASATIRRNRVRRLVFGRAGAAAALAACLTIGFAAGSMLRSGQTGGQATGDPQVVTLYQVALTDEVGNVLAVQSFESPEDARAFARDLQTWQERQERMRQGNVSLVSLRL